MAEARKVTSRVVREVVLLPRALGYSVRTTGKHYVITRQGHEGAVVMSKSPRKSGLRESISHAKRLGWDEIAVILRAAR